jgi:2-succinyl-5-enolpyruvyl-6-hydroxy-3-cyclohexene-1-carboxylate synthase
MSKTKVNKNFIWAKAFVNQLCDLGVRFACISPGSRSTPLTLAFADQKKIKCFVHIDERVSGFFALGLAKASSLPIAIVTTLISISGKVSLAASYNVSKAQQTFINKYCEN